MEVVEPEMVAYEFCNLTGYRFLFTSAYIAVALTKLTRLYDIFMPTVARGTGIISTKL